VGSPQIKEYAPGRYSVIVPIDEGVQYRIGQIALAGITLFPEGELRKAVTVKPGDMAAASALTRSCEAVRDFYESRGYMHTVVQPSLDLHATAGAVDVRLMVGEGQLTYVHNIDIRGNSVTRDKVIRRELLVYPGETFNGVNIRKSESRLRNLGYFSNVTSYDERTAVSNTSDLVFEVEEQKTGQFLVGAGFSSIDSLIGFAEVSQGNFDIRGRPFLGGGEKIKLRTEFGSRRQDYTLSFVEPWFLDRKLAFGVDLYSSSVDQHDYTVDRLGGAVSLGVALGGPSRLDFKYRLEQVEVKDLNDTNAYVYVDGDTTNAFSFQEPRHVASSLKVTYSRDTRDNVFVPTRGARVFTSGTLMGGPLGFDTDLYDFEAGATAYVPLWFHHVFSLRGRVEVVDSYGNTDDVPVSERLFAGGARTVRGFRYRWVGPKVVQVNDPSDVQPAGGQSLALANAEYTIPLVKNIRLAGFYDIGNVWYDAYTFELESLAVGAGLGIRFDIPGFPMRFDYAWPVEKDDPRTETERLSFSIGYGF